MTVKCTNIRSNVRSDKHPDHQKTSTGKVTGRGGLRNEGYIPIVSPALGKNITHKVPLIMQGLSDP